jgi:hypothetical protein
MSIRFGNRRRCLLPPFLKTKYNGVMSKTILLTVAVLFAKILLAQTSVVWTKQKANACYAKQPRLVESNYITSSAINQLEMWQAETFDTAQITKELRRAKNIGINMMRVFLHNIFRVDGTPHSKYEVAFIKQLISK